MGTADDHSDVVDGCSDGQTVASDEDGEITEEFSEVTGGAVSHDLLAQQAQAMSNAPTDEILDSLKGSLRMY